MNPEPVSMIPTKLTPVEKDLLNLLGRSHRNEEGWAKVSALLITHVEHHAPKELIEVQCNPNRARFTDKGKQVYEAMLYL